MKTAGVIVESKGMESLAYFARGRLELTGLGRRQIIVIVWVLNLTINSVEIRRIQDSAKSSIRIHTLGCSSHVVPAEIASYRTLFG